MARLTPEQIAALVERSVTDQGLPVKVTDPAVLRSVSVLLGGRADAGRAHARSASTNRAAGPSVQPHRPHPVGIQPRGSDLPGQDLHVVDDGLDDRGLAIEGQRRPRGA